jgi:hypothetical protein
LPGTGVAERMTVSPSMILSLGVAAGHPRQRGRRLPCEPVVRTRIWFFGSRVT